MPVTYTSENVLTHIGGSMPSNGQKEHSMMAVGEQRALVDRVASPSGSINILGVIVINYTFSANELDINVTLLGITIGSATINPQHPSVQIGGEVLGFKAEVTISFDFSSLVMTIEGTVCAPFAGCKSAQTQVKL